MIWRFDDHALDTGTFELRRGDEPVQLEPQVFDVLALLVEQRDRVVSKEELLDAVWGDRFVSESALTSRIKDARRAVGDDGTRQAVIRTVHGRGYRFVAEVADGAEVADVAEAPSPVDDSGSIPGAIRPAGPGIPRTRYARSGGYQIAYQVIGDGPRDILFIPGFVSNLDLHWEHPGMAEFFERLASYGRLIMLDKRGTGVSERVPTDRLPTLEERMDDVRAVLDAAGSERATLFGISEGGPMSLLFAATYPDRVEGLVLYGTFPNDPFPDAALFIQRTRDLWGQGRVLGMLAPTWLRDDVPDERNRRFLARFERQSATPDAAAALVEMVSETDVPATLASISAPTLVLHRIDDDVVPYDRGQALARGIRGARLVTLPGRDHFVWVDPRQVLDEIERFVVSEAKPAEPVQRVLTTLLFGSTSGARLTGDDTTAGGVVLTTDDEDVIAFDGPARAIRCVLDLVGASGTAVGCAVHTSEVDRTGDRVRGFGVQLGATVALRAEPGEVLVTRTVRDLVVGSGLSFAPRGEVQVEGVEDRWSVFAASR